MSFSPRSDAAIISNGGNVPRFSSLISLPRISIQLCSMGSCSWQRVLQTSHVVQTRNVSIALRSHSSLPSITSRRYAYLPRGDWLSQPRPEYCSHVGTQYPQRAHAYAISATSPGMPFTSLDGSAISAGGLAAFAIGRTIGSNTVAVPMMTSISPLPNTLPGFIMPAGSTWDL